MPGPDKTSISSAPAGQDFDADYASRGTGTHCLIRFGRVTLLKKEPPYFQSDE